MPTLSITVSDADAAALKALAAKHGYADVRAYAQAKADEMLAKLTGALREEEEAAVVAAMADPATRTAVLDAAKIV